MPVDSFKYVPRILAAYYRMADTHLELPIPWTPLKTPLSESTFSLVTTGGLYDRGVEPPFDLEREKREPDWGDPSYRTLATDIAQDRVGASHYHLNTSDVLEDVNILLPVHRFRELTERSRIGGVAEEVYSVMGYQGFPPETTVWRTQTGPELAARMLAHGVDCVFMTPA
ncbi:MAG: glycine/betaine/sarcosine/D-proline family reductase selenoprotein B [Anaerolineae bacterium]|nr:glycine/betaine/sarcosine/D-proline family reductase selenoprotein B [Anaerolineae bacterium]